MDKDKFIEFIAVLVDNDDVIDSISFGRNIEPHEARALMRDAVLIAGNISELKIEPAWLVDSSGDGDSK